MDEEVKELLNKALKKWEDIEYYRGEDKGSVNCALCQKFMVDVDIDKECIGCPVFKKAGHILCNNTPYEEWSDHQDEDHYGELFKVRLGCNKCAELANKETEFLKSLLEE